MAINIEIKARAANWAAQMAAGLAIADRTERLEQEDTFFNISNGLLKLREQRGGDDYLVFYRRPGEKGPKPSEYTLVPVADVLYLKAELKYVTIRTAAREYLLEESLAHLEEEFAEAFVRIHRNCLAAKSRIRGFEKAEVQEGEQGWVVLLEGCAEKLAVSRRQWPVVKELAAG